MFAHTVITLQCMSLICMHCPQKHSSSTPLLRNNRQGRKVSATQCHCYICPLHQQARNKNTLQDNLTTSGSGIMLHACVHHRSIIPVDKLCAQCTRDIVHADNMCAQRMYTLSGAQQNWRNACRIYNRNAAVPQDAHATAAMGLPHSCTTATAPTPQRS